MMATLSLPPAPGSDEHPSLRLVNTTYHLPGAHLIDEFATPDDTAAWLVDNTLIPAGTPLQDYCRDRVRDFRDIVTDLFAAHIQHQPPNPRALAALNQALTAVPSAEILCHGHNGYRRIANHPITQLVDHAKAQLAEDAATLLSGPQSIQLARCTAEPCTRFFLRTHARRQWCSTRCGDRVRAARAYAKRRTTTTNNQNPIKTA